MHPTTMDFMFIFFRVYYNHCFVEEFTLQQQVNHSIKGLGRRQVIIDPKIKHLMLMDM